MTSENNFSTVKLGCFQNSLRKKKYKIFSELTARGLENVTSCNITKDSCSGTGGTSLFYSYRHCGVFLIGRPAKLSSRFLRYIDTVKNKIR